MPDEANLNKYLLSVSENNQHLTLYFHASLSNEFTLQPELLTPDSLQLFIYLRTDLHSEMHTLLHLDC